jgi:hypothetical protein
MAATSSWRLDLVQRHAQLFDLAMEENPRCYPACGDGWQNVLEELCSRIETAIGQNEAFKFVRIGKDKLLFGLSIRWEGEVSSSTNAKIDEVIRLAIQKAFRTCEICGLEYTAARERQARDGVHGIGMGSDRTG